MDHNRARRGVGGLAVLFVALSLLPLRPAGAQEPDPEDPWERFLVDRADFFNELAPPFVECFQRRDSAIDPLSPIFHGCLDWHSAVHANYSHHVVFRRTGDQTFLDLAEEQIAPQGVSLIPAELAYQRTKAPDWTLGENPYGFGWFLVMARERELSAETEDFREMADFAAAQLLSWYRTRATRGDARSYILNEAHANYSWSLINLDVWARYTDDPTILAAVRDATAPLFDPELDASCPVTRDRTSSRTGFQPACLMRLVAAAHVWGDHVRDWVMARLPEEGLTIPPVTNPANCHAGGLNFSRAFALYQLYLVTGDPQYRDNYAELIRYHVGRPDLYIDPDYLGNPGYLCYSHWVAQFGVRAISLSYEDRPPAPELPPPSAQTEVGIEEVAGGDGTVTVTGASAFADQPFEELGTDARGDGDGPGVLGQDLVSAAAATRVDGRLRLRFGVDALPPETDRAARVSYGWAFCLDTEDPESPGCFEIDAWSTGMTDPEPEVEVWRCASASCDPAAQTLTGIGAAATFDGGSDTVTVEVSLDELGAAPGAALTPVSPVDAPVLTGIGDRHTAGDRLAYEGSFRTGAREVSLAVGPPGRDPAAVEYPAAAQVSADGGYAGEVDVSALEPGSHTVYVRACFGSVNCAYATEEITL
jgi:hypothetical protein